MQIARPPSGFKIDEKDLVIKTLDSLDIQCPWLRTVYQNIKERLRMVAHRTGYMIKDNPTRRYFVDVDPETEEDRLVVAYHVLGDTVTVYAIKVLVTSANTPSNFG